MNVVVIVTDSLRADHVGAYGSKVQTPSLDRLALEGTLFENSYAESLPTLPTRTTWWTGRVGFPFRPWQQFEHGDVLLAEVLWERGYTSALVTDVYHMHKPIYNCGRGFDTVAWVRGQEYDPWVVDPSVPVDLTSRHKLRGDETDVLWKPRFEQYLRNASTFGSGGDGSEEDYFAPRVVKEAIRWLDHVTARQKDNLFLWVDLFDPHEPWDPPAPYAHMYAPDYRGQDLIDPVPGPVEGYLSPEELAHTKALYAGEVTFVDRWVGILLDHMRGLGLYDNTLIMHTSDHGEPFGEHGVVRKARPWNYEELVHTPWIIRHPAGLSAGKRISAMVQATDLMPTVLDFLDIPTPLQQTYRAPTQTMFPQDMPVAVKDVSLQGFSLLPLMSGEVEKLRDYTYTGHYGRQWSIRNDDWSYLLNVDGSGAPELYDRKRDPGEQANLAEAEPEVAEHLELQLRRWAAGLSER